MLNLFNSFVCPDVAHVTVYHDDQDDHLFYMLPHNPSIVGGRNGPMFNLIAFARDFRLLGEAAADLRESETEGGLLSVTLQLAVSPQDQAKIRDYIEREIFGDAKYLRPMLLGKRVHIAPVAQRKRPIKLTYPLWTQGSSAFHVFPIDGAETFVKGLEGSKSPSLTGNNVSTYTALLGQEGMRLIRSAIEDGGWSPGTINYSVSFAARIPSLTVKVKGKTTDVYKEIKNHCQVVERYRRGNRVSTWRYPAVNDLKELRKMITSLDITVDAGDWRSQATDESSAQQISDAVEKMALELIQDYLKNTFFAAGFEPGLKVEKLGHDPFTHNSNRAPDDARLPGNQLWLKEFSQEMSAEIDFTLTARQNIEITRHPNISLFSILPPAEVKKCIIEADLSQPYFSILDVPVMVTANYERDPIAAIKVFIDYNEVDDRSGRHRVHTEEFLFDTGEEQHRFRTVMARNASGVPKDSYSYRSQIIYKASARSAETPLHTTRARSLVIGYDELNCVQVQAFWGAIPR